MDPDPTHKPTDLISRVMRAMPAVKFPLKQ